MYVATASRPSPTTIIYHGNISSPPSLSLSPVSKPQRKADSSHYYHHLRAPSPQSQQTNERQTFWDERRGTKRFPRARRLVFPINAPASLAAAKSVTRSPTPPPSFSTLLSTSLPPTPQVCHVFPARGHKAASCVTAVFRHRCQRPFFPSLCSFLTSLLPVLPPPILTSQ